MNSRINYIKEHIKINVDVDAVLVMDSINITYLTGFPSEDAWLLITQKQVYYITDSRYEEAAKKGLSSVNVKIIKDSMCVAVADILKTLKIKKIVFDPKHISLYMHKVLKSCMPKGLHLIGRSSLVHDQRMIKDKTEINNIRKSLKIHKDVLVYLKRIIKPGVSEENILFKLENHIRKYKCGFSFDTIIASGPNSSLPHARITARKVLKNDVVLVDMGIDVNGYKSDLTRMFFLGKIPKFIFEVEAAVRQAQLEAISKIRPGVAACDIDKIARNCLKQHKLDMYFKHSLGHGIGLDVHESPRLSPKDKTILKEGMIITVEPGVYIPGKFGIRIEDMVLVTKKGNKVLSDDIN